jgi:hypothetical protein
VFGEDADGIAIDVVCADGKGSMGLIIPLLQCARSVEGPPFV